MSSTQPTTPASPVMNVAPTTEVTNNSPAAQLGKDSFLQLLVAQMKDQDPTSPTDPSTFMSQLAQFSSLEQETNMSDSISSLETTSSVTQGVDLIGRNVTWTNSDGTSSSGVAQGISLSSGSVVVEVGDKSVDPSAITAVGQAPTTSSSTSQTTPTS